MSEKPTGDQVKKWIEEALDRAERAQITRKPAIADMIVRDLQARGVRLVWRPELPEQEGGAERG